MSKVIERHLDTFKFRLIKGDITKALTKVIVNAANRFLVAGGGVDGAIHKAAGFELQLYLNSLQSKKPPTIPGRKNYANKLVAHELPTGEALLTPSFDIAETGGAQFIIHCVGPVYHRSQNPEEELASCYKKALEICKENEFKTISFPSISTGTYGYPVEEGAKVAVTTVVKHAKENGLAFCQFVLFDDDTFIAYERALGLI